MELRFPDPSSNPYLAFAAMLACGLDGVENSLTPPPGLNNINVYDLTTEERKALNITELPGSLLEAMHELDKDEVVKASLGESIYEAFVRAKQSEWEDYRIKVSDWEIERYLETI